MIIDATFEEQAEIQANFGEITKVGGGYIDVDSQLSLVSTNPVQNKVITNEFNKVNSKISRKSETHLTSNFISMVEELLLAISAEYVDYYNVGDMFFLADQIQPDFMIIAIGDDIYLETTKIDSINDITPNMPKMGGLYHIGEKFVVAAIEVGFNPDEYASKEELIQLEKKHDGQFDSLDTLIVGKQDKLTFDDYPNETSENPVTSKGIDKALHDLADIQNVYIVDSINDFKENYADKTYVTKGEIETALDGIIAIQNSLIGGGA